MSTERQTAPTLDGIRRDHRARYEWVAARESGRRIVDVGCGVGYGAKILAGADCTVTAFDRSAEAIAYARAHYNHDGRITYHEADAAAPPDSGADAVACFELLEHLEDPAPALRAWRDVASRLYVSVPNEKVFPYRTELADGRVVRIRHHHRHYTRAELHEVLTSNGWRPVEWWGQAGKESEPRPEMEGRTLLAVCERAPIPVELIVSQDDDDLSWLKLPGRELPKTVAIVAMGWSSAQYLTSASTPGGRHRFVDEVWAINAMGGVIQHDRLFVMDDLAVQKARAEATPDGNVAGQMDWLPAHPGPVYTPRRYPDFPGSRAYPISWVLRRTRHAYLNNSVPYAFALALAMDVDAIHLFGCDYSYPDDKAHKREKGRACLEYWIAVACERGVTVHVPETGTLLDAVENRTGTQFYGYHTEDLTLTVGEDGFRVQRTPRPEERIPTPNQIELMYSHDQRYERLAHAVK